MHDLRVFEIKDNNKKKRKVFSLFFFLFVLFTVELLRPFQAMKGDAKMLKRNICFSPLIGRGSLRMNF